MTREVFAFMMRTNGGGTVTEIEKGLPKVRFYEGEILGVLQDLLREGVVIYHFEGESWGVHYERIQGIDPREKAHRKGMF